MEHIIRGGVKGSGLVLGCTPRRVGQHLFGPGEKTLAVDSFGMIGWGETQGRTEARSGRLAAGPVSGRRRVSYPLGVWRVSCAKARERWTCSLKMLA